MSRAARAVLALGAAALGGIAFGAVAIGALAVGRARIRRLEIEEVEIGRLRVRELALPEPGQGVPPPHGPDADVTAPPRPRRGAGTPGGKPGGRRARR